MPTFPLGQADDDRIHFNPATQSWERRSDDGGGEIEFSEDTVQDLEALTSADDVVVGSLGIVLGTGNIYRAATATAVGSTWEPASGWRNVRDYGAVAGVESTTQIQAAVSAAGGVYFPPGQWVINAAIDLNNNLHLFFNDEATLFLADESLSNMLNGDGVQNVTIEGGTLDGNQANQTGNVGAPGEGDAVNIEGSATRPESILITGCHIQNTQGWGIHVGRGRRVKVLGCTVEGTREKGVNFGGGDTSEFQIANCEIQTAGGGTFVAHGIEIDDGPVDGVVEGNIIRDTSGSGITIHSHDSTSGPERITIVGNEIHDAGIEGIAVSANRDGSSNIRDILIASNLIHSPASDGIVLGDNGGAGATTNRSVKISNNVCAAGGGDGIRVERGTIVSIEGNQVRNVNDNGIEIAPGSIARISVVGNVCDNCGTNGVQLTNASVVTVVGNRLDNNGAYGLRETGGAANNQIVANQTRNNTTNPMLLIGGGTPMVRDNIGGFVTENRGTVTLPNGSTSVVVAHGLSRTPVQGDIQVTPIEALGAATQFWIDTLDATNFTIHVDADPTQDVDFAWQAQVL